MSKLEEPKIYSVKDLLKESLFIPVYQRPYKWTIKNIEDLLTDISDALENKKNLSPEYRYRIGTVILHNKDRKYDIVDGQQRIISLALLCDVLGHPDYCNSINKPDITSSTYVTLQIKTTQDNIQKNKEFIADWFSSREKYKDLFLDALSSLLEFVVIKVSEQSEAFQLFDSQNSRGKSLEPHDLLKAYHLREMKNNLYDMQHAVRKWEAKKSNDIKELFNLYLFPIYNWCNFTKDKEFTTEEIWLYKGIREELPYTYVKKILKSMPVYQITDTFLAGEDFFGYVDHYLTILEDLRKALYTNPDFKIYKTILFSINNGLENFSNQELLKKAKEIYFAFNLFLCALLLYYDKFHNYDKTAIKKIFLWSFMIRIDMDKLGYDTINKYAIGGEDNSRYSNQIALFRKINNARKHTEISNLKINFNENLAEEKNWYNLQEQLKKLNKGDFDNE